MRIFFPLINENDSSGASDKICEVKIPVFRKSKDVFWVDISELETIQDKISETLIRIVRIICNGGMWDVSYELDNIPDNFNGSDNIESIGLSLWLSFYDKLLEHYNKNNNYEYNQKLFDSDKKSVFYKELVNRYVIYNYDIACVSGELNKVSTNKEIKTGKYLSSIANVERKLKAFINSKIIKNLSDEKTTCFIYVDKENKINEEKLIKILNESDLKNSIKKRLHIKRVSSFNEVTSQIYEKKSLDEKYCVGPPQVKNLRLSSYSVNNNIYDRRIRIEWDAVDNAVCYEVRKFEIDVFTGGYWFLIYPIYHSDKDTPAWEDWTNYKKIVETTTKTTAIDNPHIKESVILTNHYYKVRAKNKEGIWSEPSKSVDTEELLKNKTEKLEKKIDEFFKNLF